ncbi:MBL fold metallo-hydrolase [Paenibacillus hamazuiensis]|uniref:MBL fold metallo-hydrolase n=1 Tax=Paenibacillus hamazuiensis TaxID=2936508 RepID=UPI00200F214C|nr:MBL fold metallo-hydrolase [Paenibacillus hamazuiensis]
MFIQKLPWAGIRVQYESTAVVIDPLFNAPEKFGQPHEPLYPLNEFGPVSAVLITHTHYDHFDPEAIAEFYGKDIPIYVPRESLEAALDQAPHLKSVRGAGIGDSFAVGPLTVTATHSVDGVGDPQIAWIVQGGEKKIIHCGDTLWHGYWWKIAETYGPFDAACLPVNGAVIAFPGQAPSGQPITLVPEQAAAAAALLGAAQLIPNHYGVFHHPPYYVQTPDLTDRLTAAAHGKIKLTVLKAKETVSL